MKDKPLFAVIYMFVITAFFSSVLIGFSRLTRDRVEANQQLAFEKAVVQVFPTIQAKNNAAIHQIFTEQFEQRVAPDDCVFYVHLQDGEIAGYAVPVEGKGFWDTIKGVVGITPDQKIITAIAFYEQKETPGLGARIAEPDFCDQFIGRKIASGAKPIGIRSVGETLKENQVHAVTGATQTCVRLEKLINDGLAQWQQQMKQEGAQ
jgi:RnfABCDGE-type electron transport complex G subunit